MMAHESDHEGWILWSVSCHCTGGGGLHLQECLLYVNIARRAVCTLFPVIDRPRGRQVLLASFSDEGTEVQRSMSWSRAHNSAMAGCCSWPLASASRTSTQYLSLWGHLPISIAEVFGQACVRYYIILLYCIKPPLIGYKMHHYFICFYAFALAANIAQYQFWGPTSHFTVGKPQSRPVLKKNVWYSLRFGIQSSNNKGELTQRNASPPLKLLRNVMSPVEGWTQHGLLWRALVWKWW